MGHGLDGNLGLRIDDDLALALFQGSAFSGRRFSQGPPCSCPSFFMACLFAHPVSAIALFMGIIDFADVGENACAGRRCRLDHAFR